MILYQAVTGTGTHEEAARVFCEAVQIIAEKPDNLANLEAYLSHHFAEWLKKWADTPENIAGEMKQFAEMEI